MLQLRKKIAPTQAPDRKFYARSRVFGRFGMRIFKPKEMEQAHWHGHVEANYVRNARLIYMMDDKKVVVEPNALVLFWANMPHQLLKVEPQSPTEIPELCNIYLPLDAFLVMPHLAELQIALLNSGMVVCGESLCNFEKLLRWYEDYRSGDSERLDILRMELNALLWRMSSVGLCYLKPPALGKSATAALTSQHIRHTVAMIRHVLDNISTPLQNADVTSVTGLHTNYALNIFSKSMNIPLKQFILRMRLLRARGLLMESDMAIATVAHESGFGSTSQFYAQFAAAYGTSPNQLRQGYVDSLAQ